MGVEGLIRDHYLKSRVEWALENYPEFKPIETLWERLDSLEPDLAFDAARALGVWHEIQGRLEDAESAYAWGMRLWDGNPTADLCWSYSTLPLDYSRLLRRIGKKSEAKAVHEALADLCERTLCYGNPTAAGIWLHQIGLHCHTDNDLEASVGFYVRSLAIFARHKGARATAATVMEQFAEVLRDAGAHERANEMLKRAQKLRPKLRPKKAKPKL